MLYTSGPRPAREGRSKVVIGPVPADNLKRLEQQLPAQTALSPTAKGRGPAGDSTNVGVPNGSGAPGTPATPIGVGTGSGPVPPYVLPEFPGFELPSELAGNTYLEYCPVGTLLPNSDALLTGTTPQNGTYTYFDLQGRTVGELQAPAWPFVCAGGVFALVGKPPHPEYGYYRGYQIYKLDPTAGSWALFADETMSPLQLAAFGTLAFTGQFLVVPISEYAGVSYDASTGKWWHMYRRLVRSYSPTDGAVTDVDLGPRKLAPRTGVQESEVLSLTNATALSPRGGDRYTHLAWAPGLVTGTNGSFDGEVSGVDSGRCGVLLVNGQQGGALERQTAIGWSAPGSYSGWRAGGVATAGGAVLPPKGGVRNDTSLVESISDMVLGTYTNGDNKALYLNWADPNTQGQRAIADAYVTGGDSVFIVSKDNATNIATLLRWSFTTSEAHTLWTSPAPVPPNGVMHLAVDETYQRIFLSLNYGTEGRSSYLWTVTYL